MRFFVPHAKNAEAVYQKITETLKDQLGLPILDRRIASLSYTNSKKKWLAQVGQLEQQEHSYEILAIFESKQFIIYTRSKHGGAGPIILVDKNEVTATEDFDYIKPKAALALEA